ncbi:MAG TPA: ABC transporter substrate-binding protein [Microcoleaceae bacterium UBA10368]|jgi:ABC-type dipeptide/oligopeptide/nickel transport systems, permease components|nr:ABC transporter substrate-binding protein [Microcoleaceae cyanobacterium UBA10368]HCV30074.1 ABC transporter substrate-binding protein [Microcoleaceae cyanobacterium UBA9251]
MKWWQNLKNNPLARLGAVLLLIFYTVAILADFVAPYDPYDSQLNGSLLPPTQIHLTAPDGRFIWPHVYPTTQGPVDANTGDREVIVDSRKPSSLVLFVKGSPYKFCGVVPLDRHLFGTIGEGKINILGTDEQARDQFTRLVHGSRISLSIGLVGIAISFPLGLLIGGISGYFGGWIDSILMRFVEVLMTIPGLYLLVALAAVLPPGLTSAQRFMLIVMITSFISWTGLARVIRGQVLSIKQLEFVQAARAMGANPLYIIVRHVLPQTATYVIISATLSVPSFIVAESVLSLIGLGIQQPDPSWGNLLSLSTNASILVLQPWLVWPPAILIISTVLAFNLLGDGLRDALDPRSAQRN